MSSYGHPIYWKAESTMQKWGISDFCFKHAEYEFYNFLVVKIVLWPLSKHVAIPESRKWNLLAVEAF